VPTTTETATRFDELVKGIRVAMLTTFDRAGALHSRPLTVQKVDSGVVWFLVDAHTGWLNDDLEVVNVAFADGDTWVSATGSAELVLDLNVMEDLGDPVSDAWFSEEATPAALRVDVRRADYWDAPGRLVQLVHMGKSVLTQQPPALGDRGVIEP
jgi:general stress protein 26